MTKVDIPKGYIQLILELLKEHEPMCLTYGFTKKEWKFITELLEREMKL